jgi:hypothetical protein
MHAGSYKDEGCEGFQKVKGGKKRRSHPASILPQALPERGSRKGSHRRRKTVTRLTKKEWLLARRGFIWILLRSELHSSASANQLSMPSLVSCIT